MAIQHKDIAAIRQDYVLGSLSESDVDRNPVHQFKKWFDEAIHSEVIEPNAMVLSTVSSDQLPSSRVVLLKDIVAEGLVFFTNYESRKGKEMEENPFVALLFFWRELERQVRIEGRIQKVSDEESDEYFSERPRESQVGAWSSPQSTVIDSREFLQEKIQKYNEQFGAEEIPRPGYWGGYIVEPYSMEFWQGRPGRLHDRLQYTLAENNHWIIRRLAP